MFIIDQPGAIVSALIPFPRPETNTLVNSGMGKGLVMGPLSGPMEINTSVHLRMVNNTVGELLPLDLHLNEQGINTLVNTEMANLLVMGPLHLPRPATNTLVNSVMEKEFRGPLPGLKLVTDTLVNSETVNLTDRAPRSLRMVE